MSNKLPCLLYYCRKSKYRTQAFSKLLLVLHIQIKVYGKEQEKYIKYLKMSYMYLKPLVRSIGREEFVRVLSTA